MAFLSLFPESLQPTLNTSLLGRAAREERVHATLVQMRDFATDKHRSADGSPYGGGAGMLLRVDVLHAAWKSLPPLALGARRRTILLSPQGRLLTQSVAKDIVNQWAPGDEIVFVCGHYEGVDERFIDLCVDEELSIGDYVLTGGELPALVAADVLVRLLPGVVGNADSVTGDSLEGDVLKYPQFTRPREYEGREVPSVLLSGDHGAIARWRQAQSQMRTERKRPDLHKKNPAAK